MDCDINIFFVPHKMAQKIKNLTYFFENQSFDSNKCDKGEDIMENMHVLCMYSEKIVQQKRSMSFKNCILCGVFSGN